MTAGGKDAVGHGRVSNFSPQVLSVCMTLPTVANPQQGIFVYRRLQAMSQWLPVRALRPQPWFPGIRAGARELPLRDAAFPMDCRRMFYLPGVAKSLDGRWMERCVGRWLDERKPDPRHTVLDAHFAYPEGVACHRAAQRRGLPFFVTLRGVEEAWFRQPRVRDQIVGALNEASGVIAVSESLRAAAAAVGVDPARIRVIANGCDTATFHPGNRHAARRKLGLDEHKKVFVSVANIKHVKGHDLLVSALSRLRKTTDFELICIGDQEQTGYARRVKELVDQAGLTDHVRFTGSLPAEQVAEHLRAADLFVIASRREGCCNAVLEAMACGTPVVATAVGDNPLLADRFAGIHLANPEDPDALHDALLATLQGNGSLPTIDRMRFEPRSWQAVAAECVEMIRTLGAPAAASP